MVNEKVNCYKCVYYYVTWDASFPRCCKFYNFKTLNIPSILVKQSTGQSCDKFKPKGK